jgi:carbon-monoxide dehydrogenase medium subunit
MKPASFEYIAPSTLAEVLDALSEHGDQAKLLAGGQSLIPTMNFRMAQPAILIDVNSVKELAYIRSENGEMAIGAMTRQRQLERDPQIEQAVPLLHETMPHVAHPQIRNRGTLGGSLAHADPAAELPVIAVALSAIMKIKSKKAERQIEANEFFQGIFSTTLQPDEILAEIVFPAMSPNTGWSFMEVSRRKGDYAMLGIAAVVTLDGSGRCQHARLVYLNAGDRPIQAIKAANMLIGQAFSVDLAAAAADTASSQEIEPMGNMHASVAYQHHLAKVLTRRALETAFQRAAPSQGEK